MGLADLTKEQQTENLQKAQEARRAKSAARKRSTLRRDFEDADYWMELARKYKLHLPPWGEPCSVSAMGSIARKYGLTTTKVEAQLGKCERFVELNPEWPIRAWAGLVLEML